MTNTADRIEPTLRQWTSAIPLVVDPSLQFNLFLDRRKRIARADHYSSKGIRHGQETSLA
jgi:hypothetical protein